MPSVNLSLVFGAGHRFFDNNGAPLAAGKLYSYTTGTTTPKTTYKTAAGSSSHTNPIVLDSSGAVPDEVWLEEGSAYRFKLTTSADVAVWSDTYKDDVRGGTDTGGTLRTDLISATSGKGDELIRVVHPSSGVNITQHQKNLQFVHVEDFGADPLGVSDSYAAFLAAYNSGAGTIYMGAGDYRLTQGLVIRRGITFAGQIAADGVDGSGQSDGEASTRLVYEGTGICLDVQGYNYTEGLHNVHFRDFIITGNSNAVGGIAMGSTVYDPLNPKGLGHCSIRRVLVHDFDRNSGGVKGYGVKVGFCLYSTFNDVYCHGNYYGIWLYGPHTSSSWAQCNSRINQIGWFIEQSNGVGFYSCLSEGNVLGALHIITRSGQTTYGLSFYGWYSEGNCTGGSGFPVPPTGVPYVFENYGNGLLSIKFYSPFFVDAGLYSTNHTWNDGVATYNWHTPLIEFRECDDVGFYDARTNSMDEGWSEIVNPADVVGVFWQGRENAAPSTVLSNTFDKDTGFWKVQTGSQYHRARVRQGSLNLSTLAGATLNSIAGKYQKDGALVTWNASFNITAFSASAAYSAANTIKLTGLPFTADSALGAGRAVCNGTSIEAGSSDFRHGFVDGVAINLLFTGTTLPGARTVYIGGHYFASDD